MVGIDGQDAFEDEYSIAEVGPAARKLCLSESHVDVRRYGERGRAIQPLTFYVPIFGELCDQCR